MSNNIRHIIFDWGDTLMKDDASRNQAMYLWPEVCAVDGAETALKELSDHYILSVATNATESDAEMVMKALNRVNLGNYISSIFTGKTIGMKKSEIEFWKFIESDLQEAPDNILVIGDSFESDVATSTSAGFQAFWFNPHSQEKRSGERYQTIHHLSEIKPKIE
ncbi:HAD family hydrolase [Cerasicoccus arenae]|nr:HAD hydrolase-like protein [Cerasicoccus arenae]